VINKNISEISELLAGTNDPAEIRKFFESLLSPKELEDIGFRWEIVKRLNNGETQRRIAGELHLSLCKITRGSKELKKKNAIIKRFLNRLNK
jgi:TrpR family trp operon transcriptional repressor